MKVKILVGIPGKKWEADTGLCIVSLTSYFAVNRIPGCSEQALSFCGTKGSILPQLRTNIVKRALAANCTHVLFIDSDQTFPPDLIHRLLSWKVPVVAANVPTKTFPSYPTARNFDTSDPLGIPVYTTPDNQGLEKVWRVGTGIMLVETYLFERILPKPWFTMYWKNNGEDLTGEDWYFAEQLEKFGINLYIDHDLSRQVGHVGEVKFTHDMCLAELICPSKKEEKDALDETAGKVSFEQGITLNA